MTASGVPPPSESVVWTCTTPGTRTKPSSGGGPWTGEGPHSTTRRAKAARTARTTSPIRPRRGTGKALGAFLPGGQVLLLLRGEAVDLDAHGLELEPSDLAVDLEGDPVDLLLELAAVAGHVLG